MKAIVINRAGGPEVLEEKEVPTPQVKPGWSLIQIKGFGINRSEIFTRNGWSPTVKFPRILGIEGVGVIAESSDESKLPVGQTVIATMGGMGRDFDGSYAEYALTPNHRIFPVNTDLSWADLAAVPETYSTAYGSLLALKLQPADTLLVRGATSGVGIAACQLAKAMAPGIKVTGTTRKPEKRQSLLDAGFDDVVLEKDEKLQTEAIYDKVLELVGPLTLLNSAKHLKQGSILCLTGELGGVWTIDNFGIIGDFPSGSYLTNFSSDTVDAKLMGDMLAIIERHHLDVKPTKVFPLSQTREAQAFLDGASSFGKVVVML